MRRFALFVVLGWPVAILAVSVAGPVGRRPAAADGGGVTIPLPQAPATPGHRPSATDIFGADRPGEIINRAPGPVADDEHVEATFAPDGALVGVVVDQRLTITGSGDFSLKIPGPALDVRADPTARTTPGLRRGAVLWEGFSPGRRDLRATITLDPAVESLRFPIAVSVGEDGALTIADVATTSTSLVGGDADPASLAAAAARVRVVLADPSTLAGGSDRIGILPSAVAARTGTQSVLPAEEIGVLTPYRVTGTVAGRRIDALLPSAAHPDGRVTVPGGGAARQGAILDLDLTAVPALPDPASIKESVAEPAGLRSVQVAIAQVYAAAEAAVYLGDPLPGPRMVTFHLGGGPTPPPRAGALDPKVLDPKLLGPTRLAPAPAAGPGPIEHVDNLALALTLAGLAAAGFVAQRLWSRA